MEDASSGARPSPLRSFQTTRITPTSGGHAPVPIELAALVLEADGRSWVSFKYHKLLSDVTYKEAKQYMGNLPVGGTAQASCTRPSSCCNQVDISCAPEMATLRT